MRRFGVTILTVSTVLAVTVRGDGSGAAPAGSGFDRAIAAVMPKVVKLYGLRGGREPGFGTGVIVSKDGLVLTVFSLLIDARRIRAVTSDGRLYEAHVVHRDSKRQLALLQLGTVSGEEEPSHAPRSSRTSAEAEAHGSMGFPFFDLSVEATLRPGDWVLAAGNPFKVADGAEPVSVVHGVFSARTRLDARHRLKDFPYRGDVLVIDAITSNPGAPGSALVNLDGRFVGMIGREVISNLTHTHFNYAVPRDVLHAYLVEASATQNGEFTVANSQSAGNKRVARWESAGGDSSTNDAGRFDHGLRMSRLGYRRVLPFVERVRSGSPAEFAGVRKDDLILSVNGRSVPDIAAFDARMKVLAPDEAIDLVIRRGRTIVSVRIDVIPPNRAPGASPATRVPGDGQMPEEQ